MLDDIFDHVVIDDPFLLLEAVHQTLLTDTVDHTGDPRCYLENFIQRFVAKDIPLTAGIQKVRMDILFCFSAVQVRKDTVDIDPLPYVHTAEPSGRFCGRKWPRSGASGRFY